jgi:hypothetical protein
LGEAGDDGREAAVGRARGVFVAVGRSGAAGATREAQWSALVFVFVVEFATPGGVLVVVVVTKAEADGADVERG